MKIPFLFAIVLVSAITSAAENLLINPDFQGADKGTPAGWKRYSTGLAAPQTVTLDDGKKALKLEDDSSDTYKQILFAHNYERLHRQPNSTEGFSDRNKCRV